jgi:indolepyruvate ferredoxin oxidoreductase
MSQWMDRNTATYTHMGGEGVTWVGQAPFTDETHVFVNLGDGTYFHSGLLAIRMAVASGVNVTYKLLYNDAVAMTGGQPHDGPLTVPLVTHQVRGEGVERIAVVTDEPDKYASRSEFARDVTIHHRDDLEAVQRELRDIPGVTLLIYDQTCATEKRRRRKRGTYPDPAKRAVINSLVCEACGDCSAVSNCLSVVPTETPFGRKRMIDQSSCNKDFSCVNGFCPSFVTVHGGELKKGRRNGPTLPIPPEIDRLPEPKLPDTSQPYGIFVTGVGGTGVVTLGALIGMAAHMEGKGCSILDMAGLAQKGGAVTTHIRIADNPEDIHAVRLASGGARLILGCDIVVAAQSDSMAKVQPGVTQAILNTHETITGDFIHDPDFAFPGQELREIVSGVVGAENTDFVNATRLATALLGDSIASNMFLLGYAYQKGLVPVSAEAMNKVIELNGVAVSLNQEAFLWGRRAAHDHERVERIALPTEAAGEPDPTSRLRIMIERRIEFLTDYQNANHAARYKQLVDKVRTIQAIQTPREEGLTEAVAANYFKLLAYKDEYEVARLHLSQAFQDQLDEIFTGDYALRFHLAPPLLARRDKFTGIPKKREFGPWILRVFRVLARLRSLRRTPLDIFGYTKERKTERRLIREYESTIDELLAQLNLGNHDLAVEIARIPEKIRGYGHIKAASIETADRRHAELLEAYRNPEPMPVVTAAE